MSNSLGILRSNTFGSRPASSSQPAGSPYVNFADKQFGVVDGGQIPQDLIGVPFFSTTSNYNTGQPVNYLGSLYVALSTVVAGPWNVTQWSPVATTNLIVPSLEYSYSGMQTNGGMDISQFNGNTVVNLTSGSGSFIVDGWMSGFTAATSGATFTSNQVANPNWGLNNALQLKCGVAATNSGTMDWAGVLTSIEGYRMARLDWGFSNASPITISFWINCTVTGTFCVDVRNGAGNRNYLSNVVYTAAGVWQYCQVTVPGDTIGTWALTNATGMTILLIFGAGSGYLGAANTWQVGDLRKTSSTTNFFGTANNIVNVTGFTVVQGTSGPSSLQSVAIARNYVQELSLCKRYYNRQQINIDFQAAGAAHVNIGSYFFSMRATPTATVVSVSQSNNNNNTLTNTNASATGGAFQLQATAAGRCYYYGTWQFDARI
jgi:hypothetical protein